MSKKRIIDREKKKIDSEKTECRSSILRNGSGELRVYLRVKSITERFRYCVQST